MLYLQKRFLPLKHETEKNKRDKRLTVNKESDVHPKSEITSNTQVSNNAGVTD